MIAGMGERLKKLRQKQQLTQSAVAQVLGVTRATISGYEHGVSLPPADILIKLASLYRCTSDYILGLNREGVYLVKASSLEEQERIYQILSLMKKD